MARSCFAVNRRGAANTRHRRGGYINPRSQSRSALSCLDCELRDHGEWGVEVQVYREREFLYGRRWATRALALEEANERKAQYLREGGVLLG
jgi:hypothetical protein